MKTAAPTADDLRRLLDYNPATGVLTWKYREQTMFSTVASWKSWNSRFAKIEAGTFNNGYRQVCLNGRFFGAHRLAWVILTGAWPSGEIDHINGEPADNRFCNLRDVSHDENERNQRLPMNNQSGRIGVGWRPLEKKWEARIKIHGKTKYLGMFDSFEDACSRRADAEHEFGFHYNHGRKWQRGELSEFEAERMIRRMGLVNE